MITMLVDVSNMLYASYFVAMNDKDLYTTEDKNNFWKKILVGMILNVKNQYKPDEVILSIDSKNTWRKDYFKYYKARRILKKVDSDIDWSEFYKVSDLFLDEIKNNLPVKTIKVEKAEADDIIATLAINLRDNKIIIVSRDKDFGQLLKYDNIIIHNPMDNKLITCNDPHTFLTLHFLQGDAGDDVPNLLSPDNIHVTTGKRQKCITQGTIKEVLENGLDKYVIDNNLIENYERNRKLIELSLEIIPEEIQIETMYQYNNSKIIGDFEDMCGYLKRNNMESILNNL